MAALTRRAFLALTALFTPLARLGVTAQSPTAAVSLEEFMLLSQRLTGRTNLDRQAGATYLGALQTVPANATALAQWRAAVTSPSQVALEQTIIEWWYTGVYTIKGERRLATHTGALMWSALGVRAPGTCATTFGAWASPQRTAP